MVEDRGVVSIFGTAEERRRKIVARARKRTEMGVPEHLILTNRHKILNLLIERIFPNTSYEDVMKLAIDKNKSDVERFKKERYQSELKRLEKEDKEKIQRFKLIRNIAKETFILEINGEPHEWGPYECDLDEPIYQGLKFNLNEMLDRHWGIGYYKGNKGKIRKNLIEKYMGYSEEVRICPNGAIRGGQDWRFLVTFKLR